MPARVDYRAAAHGHWRLVYHGDLWDRSAEETVLEMVEAQPWAKHPQTLPLRLTLGARERELYLKVFHPGRGAAAWKDALRPSKALRAWRLGLELDRAGFAVPVTVAAGERRRARFLRRAFVLTEKIDGEPAHTFLRAWVHCGESRALLAAKRAGLRRAAGLIRRFHRAGFVHGDLVASNLLVAFDGSAANFVFMDNDRTRRYPAWLPQPFWKRNLTQLNRMPLPGITLQDRMRFFKAYLEVGRIAATERGLAQWLEQRTRRRREECDGVDGSGDFRRLMSCSGESFPPADARELR
jgi:hypothetical protein